MKKLLIALLAFGSTVALANEVYNCKLESYKSSLIVTISDDEKLAVIINGKDEKDISSPLVIAKLPLVAKTALNTRIYEGDSSSADKDKSGNRQFYGELTPYTLIITSLGSTPYAAKILSYNELWTCDLSL